MKLSRNEIVALQCALMEAITANMTTELATCDPVSRRAYQKIQGVYADLLAKMKRAEDIEDYGLTMQTPLTSSVPEGFHLEELLSLLAEEARSDSLLLANGILSPRTASTAAKWLRLVEAGVAQQWDGGFTLQLWSGAHHA